MKYLLLIILNIAAASAINISESALPLTSPGQLVYGKSLSYFMAEGEADFFYNPAYLANDNNTKGISVFTYLPFAINFISDAEVSTFHAGLAFEREINNQSALGALIYYAGETIPNRDSIGTLTGDTTLVNSMIIQLPFRQVFRRPENAEKRKLSYLFKAGTSLNLYTFGLGKQRGWAGFINIGLGKTLFSHLELALSVRNLGTSMHFDTLTIDLKPDFSGGARLNLLDRNGSKIKIGIALEKCADQVFDLNYGVNLNKAVSKKNENGKVASGVTHLGLECGMFHDFYSREYPNIGFGTYIRMPTGNGHLKLYVTFLYSTLKNVAENSFSFSFIGE